MALGDGGKARMKDQFVHTGQTFTGGGDAYCPLERKRRGPAALAAALMVLTAGGAFLVFSAASTPQRIAETPLAAPLAVEPATVAEAAAPQLTVEQALAESRAARAEIGLAGGDLEPRLKPAAAATGVKIAAADGVVETAGVAPSLKSPLQENGAAVPAPRPLRIGGVAYASDEDAPPPFFFAGDIEPRRIMRRTSVSGSSAARISSTR